MVSILNSSSPFKEKTYLAFHSEYGLGHGASVIGEFGLTSDTVVSSNTDTSGRYFLLQATLRPTRGLYLYQTLEYIKRDTSSENYTMRLGPGLQWFVDQGLEFRFDLLNDRSVSSAASGGSSTYNDNWEFISQVHLWL